VLTYFHGFSQLTLKIFTTATEVRTDVKKILDLKTLAKLRVLNIFDVKLANSVIFFNRSLQMLSLVV
jgi:hypothetical protein